MEFKVKTGPVTILGMTQTADGRLKMLAASGGSLPGPTLQIGKIKKLARLLELELVVI